MKTHIVSFCYRPLIGLKPDVNGLVNTAGCIYAILKQVLQSFGPFSQMRPNPGAQPGQPEIDILSLLHRVLGATRISKQ